MGSERGEGILTVLLPLTAARRPTCSNVDEVFTSEDPVDSVVEGSKIP
jgi:hypothetical protein